MTSLRFAFVLHIHQPVGNFDFVFSQHADDVYTPFLDFLEERELWPIGLHVSGPLLEWLGQHDVALHDRIGRLAVDGKAELLSAGWYEPILASLSRVDRATQLGWMREELESRFGVTPEGVWLTERVWDPELAADLADAGIAYTLVDDHLLRRAGATSAQLLRPLRTERDGRSVDIFAIDEGLRYLIPFKPADQVAADMRRRHAAGDPLALFADDGEKFGGWPRTREWLYDQGWLAAFGDEMDALRADGAVRLVTTATARQELGPDALLSAYQELAPNAHTSAQQKLAPNADPMALNTPTLLLPTFDMPKGSYPEMDEWARGPWTNFLDRYAEAGRLHTWMSELSEACAARGDPTAVRRAIGKAQCNDAYWHGVFGGLYMKHLREGVRRWMATAERELRVGEALAWEPARERDGSAAHWVHSARLSARVSAEAGGTLAELVWLQPKADVTDYLTRRLEAYHEEAVARGVSRRLERAGDEPQQGDPAAASASIHDIEEGSTLERLPMVDPDVRVLVRDRVLGDDVTFDAYRDGTFAALWSARRGELVAPEVHSAGDALVWHFGAASHEIGGGPGNLSMTKSITITDDRVEIEWRWAGDAFPGDAWFCPEFSFGCDVDLTMDPTPSESWTYPIVTVSKCPDGFEEIEQGTSVTPRWPAGLGRARAVIRPLHDPDEGGVSR